MTPDDLESTLLSQFANSPVLTALVQSMNDAIDPRSNLALFYQSVWNVQTAVGWGLDVWGRIVGVSRSFTYQTVNYTLSDSDFRTLILVKALANICDSSAGSFNRLLTALFAGQRCYVNDLGNMHMAFIFEFVLTANQLALLAGSGAMPHPAGVGAKIVTAPTPTFGFLHSGLQPFNQGTFAQTVYL